MLERAIVRKIASSRIPFIETNDLIVLKVLAGRQKDLEDVRTLLHLDLSEVDVALVRRRLMELEQVLDDSTLVALFDRLRPKPKRGRS